MRSIAATSGTTPEPIRCPACGCREFVRIVGGIEIATECTFDEIRKQILLRLDREEMREPDGVCVELYEKHEEKLRKLFKDRYVRLSYNATDPGQCFAAKLEPRSFKGTDAGGDRIIDTPLSGTVISMFVMKHLRADRILDPAYENTAYSEDDLARALLNRQVTLQGTFVRAS
jgi:hypothetical protein